jgi:hypothetical protein
MVSRVLRLPAAASAAACAADGAGEPVRLTPPGDCGILLGPALAAAAAAAAAADFSGFGLLRMRRDS